MSCPFNDKMICDEFCPLHMEGTCSLRIIAESLFVIAKKYSQEMSKDNEEEK